MSPETIKAKAEEKRIKKLEKKAQRKGVDTETFIRNATINTKRIGKAKGDVDPYANASFKDRATLSKTPPKIKAKNVRPVSSITNTPDTSKDKKGLFKGKSDVKPDIKQNKTVERPDKIKQKNADPSVKEKPKETAKETVKSVKSKTEGKKNETKTSLADMANKVQEFNESKGSSKNKKGKK